MLAEIKHTLRRQRGQLIGWAMGVALYGLMMALLYPSVGKMENLDDLINAFPPEMVAFFENIRAIGTPMGYLDVYFFAYMHLIVGILAIMGGAGLVVGDEEKGILDLVLAHPISRDGLFWGRLAGLALVLALVLLAGWLGWAIPAGGVGLELSWIELLLPFLPLLAVLLLFACLSVLLSLLVPAGRIAGALAGAIQVGSYLLLGMANLTAGLEPLARLTPLYYYQGGTAVEELNVGWLSGLLAFALLFAAAAWLLFRRRDIRVGGERSWHLPRLLGRRTRRQAAQA